MGPMKLMYQVDTTHIDDINSPSWYNQFIWNINQIHIDGLVQDCGDSIALAMELPQSWTKLLIYLMDF